jgi:hypothetical protein
MADDRNTRKTRQSKSNRNGATEDRANRSRQQTATKGSGRRSESNTTPATQRTKLAGAYNSKEDSAGKAPQNKAASARGKHLSDRARHKTAARKAAETGTGPKIKKISPKLSTPAAREMRQRTGRDPETRRT